MKDKDLINALKTSFEMTQALSKRAYEVDNQIAEFLLEQQNLIKQLATLFQESRQSEREFRIKTSERIYNIERKIS